VVPGAHRVWRTRERVTLHTRNINGEIQTWWIKLLIVYSKKIVLRHFLCHYCARMSHGEGEARGHTNDLPSG